MREAQRIGGIVLPEEIERLSLAQVLVLSAIRQLRTRKRVAEYLRREEKDIGMIILRIRKQGIVI